MRYFIFVVLAALLLGCITPQPPVENDSLPVVRPADNGTVIPVTNQTTPRYSVDVGDRAWVDYTLWVDGEVYDTTNATIANESGIYNRFKRYEPFEFVVNFDQGLIPGFVINVIGMRVNETVTFEVDPSRGYGLYDPRKVIVIPRYYNISIVETFPREAVGIDNESNVSKGDGFETPYGTAFVEDINEENVTLVYMLQAGQNLTFNGMPQQVLGVNNLTAFIAFMFEENQTYILPDPQTGQPTRYVVIEKAEQNFTLDSNHPLANKTLEFEVTLIKFEPGQPY